MSAADSSWKSLFSACCRVAVHLTEDNGILDAVQHELMHQRALVGKPILMVAHANHHHLGMLAQTSQILIARRTKLQHEEFHARLDAEMNGVAL